MSRILAVVFLCLPASEKPAALLLRASGSIRVVPADGEPMDGRPRMLLYPGDKLTVGDDGEAVLVFQKSGARETLRPGVEATIGEEGSTPEEAVAERRERNGGTLSAALTNLAPGGPDGRTAAVVSRAGPKESAVTPILGSTVVSDRPDLAWEVPEEIEAKSVVVSTGSIKSGPGRVVFRARPGPEMLTYPESEAPLKRGFTYQWRVLDQDRKMARVGEFRVATEAEKARIEELSELAETGDSGDRLAAAWALESLGAISEAIAVLKRLADDEPDEPDYRDALDELKERHGLEDVDGDDGGRNSSRSSPPEGGSSEGISGSKPAGIK